MPVKNEPSHDLLNVYVQLASSRGAAMSAQELRQQFGNGIDRLLETGAAQRGRPVSMLNCPACYEDHTAKVEYNATSRQSWIFCPEAGRVRVNDASLATVHLNTHWLPDQLTQALQIALKPPRRSVVDGAAWLLGDTVVGSTKVSVELAVGIRGASEVDELIVGLGGPKVLDIGLLVVADCSLPNHLGAVSQYAAVALDDLAFVEDGSIRVDHGRLGAWIRGLLRGQARPVLARGGRLPSDEKILTVFESRRTRGQPYVSKSAEAKAILDEWLSAYPEEARPGHSTIRKHLPEPKQVEVKALRREASALKSQKTDDGQRA